MSIRVGKYDYQNKVQPTTPGYEDVLIHTTGTLSPYTMKDAEGRIMENYWQFSKVWNSVEAIKQPVSRFQPDKVRWEHPAEVHVDEHRLLTPQYWAWREKGMTHETWVRYPNGIKLHPQALCSILGTPGSYEVLDYISARKRIYYQKYREIAITTRRFKQLQKTYQEGGYIQINEVDGPTYAEEYPYNQTVNGSIEINPQILNDLINNPRQAFGHGYSLAACILGIESFD